MRSLYWKIFLSFWLATGLIIITTAWITQQIVHKSSIPSRERLFMDSYANAAVATYESGKEAALLSWLDKTSVSHYISMYLLSNQGEIVGQPNPPESIQNISQDLIQNTLEDGIIKSGNIIISHPITTPSGKIYRLAALTDKPLTHFIEIPWAGLTLRITLAIFVSGFICYLLSLYLTQPIRVLSIAARAIAKGKLNTRVGHFIGHNKDEIAVLSDEFNSMAEQLEALIDSKKRLLQDISHELCSPLSRLQIVIELGRNKTKHLADVEFDRMELECERLNELIREIIEFARLDTSITTLSLESAFLPDILNDIILDANFEFKQHNKSVVIDVMQPCNLTIDEKLIRRAVENILRNALHYSPENKPVHVSLYFDKESIYIDIEDYGTGVPEDQLLTIFNPFYRVDTSREKKTGGYGLGLAIASQAISLHHGKIIATNKPSGGLLVKIILPLQSNTKGTS
jgi:two-component system sensor histidine kinase CpxA